MSNLVEIISKTDLEKMHTKSLLVRRLNLLKCEDEIAWPPNKHKESLSNLEKEPYIEYKETELWKKAYLELKEVLAKRENIPSKADRKKIRIEAAKNNKGRDKRGR